MTRLAGSLLPGSRLRRQQVAAYASAWDAHHGDGSGPVWAVLGDSTAQGVGASAYDRGYVGLLAAHLPEHQVRNLSVSGAGSRTSSGTSCRASPTSGRPWSRAPWG
jgi:hypothetical protein